MWLWLIMTRKHQNYTMMISKKFKHTGISKNHMIKDPTYITSYKIAIMQIFCVWSSKQIKKCASNSSMEQVNDVGDRFLAIGLYEKYLLIGNKQRNHSRKSIQLNRLKSEQRQTNTGDRLSKRLNVHIAVSTYIPTACKYARANSEAVLLQQGNTNHVDVAGVRMHNRRRRALVGNAVNYICGMTSGHGQAREVRPEFPNERQLRNGSSSFSCRICSVCTGTLINYPPSPIM